MLELEFSAQFKKDYKLAQKRGLDTNKLKDVIIQLQAQKSLAEKFHDHPLADSRLYKGMRECHVDPDWLLIYQINDNMLILKLVRTGSHSDLF